MKRLISCFTLFIIAAPLTTAQNRHIEFESKKSWKKIVEQAKTGNKIIFVDCSAEWCGHCKALAANVFTRDEVADFFNGNFVNVKYDMEKDKEGVAHREAWGIKSYPTLLFIDPETEHVIHKLTGAGDAGWLVKEGRAVLDFRNDMDAAAAMVERYNGGERDPAFVSELIETLRSAQLGAPVENVIASYFSELTPEEMAEPENLALILQYAADPISMPLNLIYGFREGFYALLEDGRRQALDAKLDRVVINTAVEFALHPYLVMSDQKRYDAFVNFLDRQPDSPAKDISAVWLNTSFYSRAKEWQDLLDAMKAVEANKILTQDHMMQYLPFFMTSLGRSGSRKCIDEGIKWLDGLIEKAYGEDMGSYVDKLIALEAKLCLYRAADMPKRINATNKERQACLTKIQALREDQVVGE